MSTWGIVTKGKKFKVLTKYEHTAAIVVLSASPWTRGKITCFTSWKEKQKISDITDVAAYHSTRNLNLSEKGG